jgi:hypothetical protein
MLKYEVGDAVVASQVSRIEAGKPYIIVTDEDMSLISTQVETAVPVASYSMPQVKTSNYAMTGTLQALSAEEVKSQHIYLLDGDGYWNLGSNQALLPYRAYMQATTSDMPNSVETSCSGDTTPVLDLEMNEEQEAGLIYDLQGCRVLNPKKGSLYIINNKKVIY